jgi:hypothetical protein
VRKGRRGVGVGVEDDDLDDLSYLSLSTLEAALVDFDFFDFSVDLARESLPSNNKSNAGAVKNTLNATGVCEYNVMANKTPHTLSRKSTTNACGV